MDKPPLEGDGQHRESFEQVIKTLFFDRSSDGKDDNGPPWVGAVGANKTQRRRRELLEIESVVGKRHGFRSKCQARKMAARGFGASHDPFCFGELGATLPF